MTFHNRNLLNSASRGIDGDAQLGEFISSLTKQFEDFRGTLGSRLQHAEDEIEAMTERYARERIYGDGPAPDRASSDEAIAAFLSASQRKPVSMAEVDEDYRASLREYAPAFAAWLRRGDALPMQVKGALQVGSDPDGGFFVAPEMARDILIRTRETSPMREIARVQRTNSDAFEFPIDVNDATTGGWIGEADERGATDTPKIGLQRVETFEQFAQPEVTQKLLDDSSFDVEGWLAEKIADKLGRDEDAAFVVGNGSSKPRGFLDYGDTATAEKDEARKWGILQYVPTGTDGGIAGDALHDCVAALRPIFRRRAVWIMNRETAALVRKLKNSTGDYLWTDGLSQDQPSRLLGFPVRDDFEGMPAPAANSFSIALGDFRRGYLILDRTVVRTLRDPFTRKGFVKFYSTKRVGGDVVNFDAIKLLKFSVA